MRIPTEWVLWLALEDERLDVRQRLATSLSKRNGQLPNGVVVLDVQTTLESGFMVINIVDKLQDPNKGAVVEVRP